MGKRITREDIVRACHTIINDNNTPKELKERGERALELIKNKTNKVTSVMDILLNQKYE